MDEDNDCYEYLLEQNSGNPWNEILYEKLYLAIPEPKSDYCKWVIDQFLIGNITLEDPEHIAYTLEYYIENISDILPGSFNLVLDNIAYLNPEEDEEEDDQEIFYAPAPIVNLLSSKMQTKKKPKYER
jgi:hypothetical protein